MFAAVAGVLLAIYLRGYPHLGGFQSDDWGGAARTRFSGGWWNEVSSLWGVSGKRPLLMFYNPTSYRVFGDNAAHHHLWQLLLSLIAVTSFFWLLRELDVPALWAGLVGLLVLFYPAADSLRLWISVDYGNLSLAFCALGIIAAIRGLRAPPGRRRWVLLVSSCVLYVLSLTLYEVTAALIAGAGLIYLLARLPLRAVWRKWAADLVVTAIIVWGFILGHWVPHQPGVNLPHGGNYLHDRLLLFRDQGLDLARDSTPLVRWWPPLLVVVLALAIGVAAGMVARRRGTEGGVGGDDRSQLLKALAMTVGGLAVIVAAFVVFVPADAFYYPAETDIGNRNNALAAYGYVLMLVGAALLIVALMAVFLPRWRRWLEAGFAVLLFAGVLSYASQLRTEAHLYEQAAQIQHGVLNAISGAFPRDPRNKVLFAFDYQGSVHPDLGTFVQNYDLAGALKLRYHDPTIGALPIRDASVVMCQPDGISYTGLTVPYAQALFVAVSHGYVRSIRTPAECRAALASGRFPSLTEAAGA